MSVCAIYARISTEEQRPTSIEDQVRRCRETAAREGLEVDDKWVFADVAISGTAKGRLKRVAYQRLMDAIKARLVDVVFFDDVSRASRDMEEGGKIMALVKSMGLRVVTSDGIDSKHSDWWMLWSLKLMTAVQQVEGTATQVVRGMVGQLERGYQIAQPPFGYTGVQVKDNSGKPLGTSWVINEKEAELLRTMFTWRQSGKSAAKIAHDLNVAEILPPGYRRCKGVPYWRPASVHRVLGNTIYRGIFVWNGSSFTMHKAKRMRREVETIEFERPDLRLVSDEVWNACNPRTRKSVIRGGGRHALSGVMSCGYCNALLSINAVKRENGGCSYTARCPQCEQAKRVSGPNNFIGYSSLDAAKLALEWCLLQVFGGEVLAEFHARLQARLIAGPAKEEFDLRRRLSELDVALQRMKKLSMDPEIGEDLFRKDLSEACAEQRSKQAQLQALMRRSSHVTKAAVELQSGIAPLPLIRRLLDGEPEPYKVRATLRRLISRFALVAKPRKFVSVYELTFVPGVAVAEVSGSEVLDDGAVSFRVTLSTSARRPVKWVLQGERI
jgi:DNA invertase Pin-like site-specific DNA recombinase